MIRVSKTDFLAAIVCGVVATLFACLPHLQGLILSGSAEFLKDGDDVLYLAIARAPYHGAAELVDPFDPQSNRPTLYPWLPYVPSARLAAAAGVPLIHLGFVWRLVGGLLLGMSLYTLYRCLFERTQWPPLLAVAATFITLADPGVLGRPIVGLVLEFQTAMTADPAGLEALQQGFYRVTTPLLVLPPLFLLLAVLTRPLALPNAFLAAVLIALLIYLYFFLWTATVGALAVSIGLLALGGLLRREVRPDYWRQALWLGGTLAVGLALGAPQIISNSQSFADPALKPALDRMSRGVFIPAGDPLRSMYLKNVWALGTLAVGFVGVMLLAHRGITLLWILTLVGFGLRNSAMVTGLEFENYHWNYVHSPFGHILLVSIAILMLERLGVWTRNRGILLLMIAIAAVGASLFTHWQRCRLATTTVALRKTLADLIELRPALEKLDTGTLLAGPKTANVALLFTKAGQLYQFDHTSHSSLTTDDEVNDRYALNAWLLDADVTQREQPKERFQVSLLSRPEWEWPAVTLVRSATYFEINADGGTAMLKRYPVTHLLKATQDAAPSRGGPWTLVQQGETWSLWKRSK